MTPREIVIISGKGGTGKTTVASSLVPYLEDLVIGDCDVDAPDLKILFRGEEDKSYSFSGLQRPVIDKEKCVECGKCHELCKFRAIDKDINFKAQKCEGCGLCEYICPEKAIEMKDYIIGDVMHSSTDYGKMIHGKLIPGEETSGKLVGQVRQDAYFTAKESGKAYVLIDGSPGLACNVISSITGAPRVVIVVEATKSGLHDLERVYQLVSGFKIEVSVVINKYDLSLEMTNQIENYCKKLNIDLDLKIPFDKRIIDSIRKLEIPSIREKAFFDEIGFSDFAKKIMR